MFSKWKLFKPFMDCWNFQVPLTESYHSLGCRASGLAGLLVLCLLCAHQLAGAPWCVYEGATQTYLDLSFVKKQKIQAIKKKEKYNKIVSLNICFLFISFCSVLCFLDLLEVEHSCHKQERIQLGHQQNM
jgi:hypothetical protein